MGKISLLTTLLVAVVDCASAQEESNFSSPSIHLSVSLPKVYFNSRGIEYPAFRYKLWEKLDAATKVEAKYAGYSEETWNVPGTAEFEQYTYETIEFDSLALAVARQNDEYNLNKTNVASAVTVGKTRFEALFDLGFKDWEVYDCYVNHYRDYWWDDMEISVKRAYRTLGWSEPQWNGLMPPPDSEGKEWYELTEEEQKAAAELCYLPETWAQLSLEFWAIDYAAIAASGQYDQAGLEGIEDDGLASNDTPDAEPVDNLGKFPKPVNRFYPWDTLPQEVQEVVLSLGYTPETWRSVLGAPIEKKPYRDLDVEEFVAVDSLGFGPGDKYDCWINHYHGYSWAEIVAVGVAPYWETLGWTARSWQGLSPPPTIQGVAFENLTEEQQRAALQLCYTTEMWNGQDFLVAPGTGTEITLAPVGSTTITVPGSVSFPEMELIAEAVEEEEAKVEQKPIAASTGLDDTEASAGVSASTSVYAFSAMLSMLLALMA